MNYFISFLISVATCLFVLLGYMNFLQPHEEFYVVDLKKILREMHNKDEKDFARYVAKVTENLEQVLEQYNGVVFVKGSVVENGQVKDITDEVISRLKKGN